MKIMKKLLNQRLSVILISDLSTPLFHYLVSIDENSKYIVMKHFRNKSEGKLGIGTNDFTLVKSVSYNKKQFVSLSKVWIHKNILDTQS